MIVYKNQATGILVRERNGSTNKPHIHHNAEIMICLSGSLRAFCGEKGILLQPGDVMVSFPNMVHHYERTGTRSRALFCRAAPEELPLLSNIFSRKPVSAFFTGRADLTLPLAEALQKEYAGTRSHTVLVGYLYVILGEFLKEMRFEAEGTPVKTDLFSAILAYIAEHFTEKLTLKTLSFAFGITPSYISRTFSMRLGCNFTGYVNGLRLDRARKMLKETDLLVGEIAWRCGFSCQRTFNRAFSAAFGMPPRTCRKENV